MSALHPSATSQPMQEVIAELGRVRSRGRGLLVLQRSSLILASLLAVLIAIIAFDFSFRLPAALRLVLLVGGLGVLAWAIWRYLVPAVSFRPSLTQVALRVESVLPAVAGRLASSVEFASAGMDQQNPLAQRAVRETARRLSGESLGAVVNPSRTRRDVAIALAMVTVSALLAAWNPVVATTGIMRVIAPYGQTRWPARTGVESMIERSLTGGVFARGEALPVRANVVRGPLDQRVEARYRLRNAGAGAGTAAANAGGWGQWQRIVLTHQGGGVHERLIDTNADALEIYFITDDDETTIERIELAPPPAIRRASLRIEPPPYAIERVSVYESELGQGIDDRAMTDAPSLIGSQATLRLELNKPLPTPRAEDREQDAAAWIKRSLGWPDDVAMPQFAVDSSSGTTWTIRWALERSYTLSMDLRDEHGLANAEPIQFRIEAAEDRVPSVTITRPAADETVLPTAVIALRAEGRDDVGLERLGLHAHVQAGGASQEDALAAAPAWTREETSSATESAVESSIELASLHLKRGDTVLITGVAQDVYELNGVRHEPARSAARRLRVIDDTELATQLRRQLGAVRQNAIRIEAQQGELQDDVHEDGLQPGMSRAQAQIGERLAAQRQSVEEIERLLRQNQLDDAQLQDILRQTNDLLDFAGRASSKATESIQRHERGPASASRRDGTDAEPSSEQATRGEGRAEQSTRPERDRQSPTSGGQPRQGEQNQGGRHQGDAPRAGAADGAQDRGEQRPGEPARGGQDPEAAADAEQERSPEEQEVMEAQQEVRDELADLIKLLDRDEDTWVVKRQLENISQEQAELEQATRNLGQQTVGQRAEDLTERQRSELDRIAERQRDLTQQTRDLIEQMRERADALEQVDPQAAESMRDAANTAEANQLDRDMEQAAQRVQQNQMTSAGASQQNAQRTMQRMMENMDQDKRAAAQQLLRQLASLIESIQRLITVQENELSALAVARDVSEFGGLDRNMIRLSQNTQAVAQEARASGQQSRRVARTLDRAADAQGAAVADLRAVPINAAGAEEAESRSLELLREAKTLAETLQQQTAEEEIQRRREELVARYRAFAERQVALRDQAMELSAAAAQAPLDRRQLVEARRIGSQQEELRQGLAEMRDTTSELLDSPVFSHVHRSIDGWSSQATDKLAAGTVDIDVTDRQKMIADAIGRLIAAVEESFAPPPEFAQDQQNQNQQQEQQNQQQQQQPLIPPAVQLKLLQGVQEQVYDLTKDLDQRLDLNDAQRRDRLRDLGQQQRELGDLARQMLEALESSRPQMPEAIPDQPSETPEQPQEQPS